MAAAVTGGQLLLPVRTPGSEACKEGCQAEIHQTGGEGGHQGHPQECQGVRRPPVPTAGTASATGPPRCRLASSPRPQPC